VTVGMRVLHRMCGRNRFRDPAHHPGQIENAQKNQHQPNRQLHRETDPRWNDETEQDDRGTHNKNRDCVTHAPEDPNQRRMADASLAGHNRSHSDDVVRIRRVAHAEKKSKSNDGKQSDHLFSDRRASASTRAAAFEKLQIFDHSVPGLSRQFENFHARSHRLDVASRRGFVKFYRSAEIRLLLKIVGCLRGLPSPSG
jgi:hypothetical protein